MIFYYVDALVTGQSPLPEDPDFVGGPYQQGRSYRLPSGQTVTINGPSPSQGIYTGVEDTNPWPQPEEYYNRITDLFFEGTAGSAAATVRQQKNPQQQPIATVFDRQKSNLDSKLEQVLAQGVTVTTSTGVHDLQSGGQMITQYWSTNIWTLPGATEVTTVTLHEEGVPIKGTDLDEIATQIGLLYAAANGNWLALLDEMKALLAADDWQALADFDIDRGWPAAPGNGSAEQVDISLLAAVVNAPAFHADTGGVPQLGALWAHLNANLSVRADPQELLRRWNARP